MSGQYGDWVEPFPGEAGVARPLVHMHHTQSYAEDPATQGSSRYLRGVEQHPCQPQLGCASTGNLISELDARLRLSPLGSRDSHDTARVALRLLTLVMDLDYRTVDA